MITNKDICIENGNIILNGDKYPLDGQSPETIMGIVKDNSDTIPTASSDNPVKSSGIKNYVDNTIKIEYVSGSITTLAANSKTSLDITLTTPIGYTAVGVTSAFTSSSNVAVVGYYVDKNNSKLAVKIANLSASDLSNVNVAATALYIRS